MKKYVSTYFGFLQQQFFKLATEFIVGPLQIDIWTQPEYFMCVCVCVCGGGGGRESGQEETKKIK